MKQYAFWFVVGSQCLYGDDVLETVDRRAAEMAAKMSAYPGCVLVDDLTVRFETDDYRELLRCGQFLM